MKEGDKVYVRRGTFLEAAVVDHVYTSASGKECVSLRGPNVLASDVITYDEYWENQRAKLEESVQ